jgi:hypothetical protein
LLDDAQGEANLLFEEASKRLQPKVLVRELYIDEHNTEDGVPTITIGEEFFKGKALKALDGVHRVLAYVATCGDEMEKYDLYSLDMLAPFWLDIAKTQALGFARRELLTFCREKWHIIRPHSVNPGSGNVDIWPIEAMQGLFRLLGGGGEVGVTLTASSLMIPNKSIAGLMFASQESDWESCAYCERKNCPSRRAPFKEKL